MMRVDDIRAGERRRQPEGQRMGRVAAQVSERAQDADSQPIRLAVLAGLATKTDQLAVDFCRECPRQFERVPLTAAE